MTKSIFLLIILTLFSCANSQVATKEITTESNEQNDTLKYKELSNQFYQGSNGKVYIKTRSLIKPPEEYGPERYREVPVADVKSYINLSGFYGKDKFHIYRDIGTTDGRNIVVIEEADPKTFSVIHYRLAMDKNHVFYNGIIVNGINADSLIILCNKPNIDFSASYGLIKDNRNLFYENRKMETIDVESFECICGDSTVIYQDKFWIYDDDYFPSMDPEKRSIQYVPLNRN